MVEPIEAPGWKFDATTGDMMDEIHLGRRVRGINDIRLDGITDLLCRARGASVLDVGCNRGHVGYEFAINGARLVHGCDIWAPGIQVARHWFAELPHCRYQFEVLDLEKGPEVLGVFGDGGYDIVLFIGVYHKLVRVMDPILLHNLVRHLGHRALKLFAWNGYEEHFAAMDEALQTQSMYCCHKSEISIKGRPAAIWRRE